MRYEDKYKSCKRCLSPFFPTNKSNSDSSQKVNNNSQLLANNININTNDATNIKGATLKANESLNIDTTNLNIASVQNTTKSDSSSKGGSVGMSSIGVNQSNSKSNSKTTVLNSLEGDNVNINTTQDTTLLGATVSSTSDNLNLTTNTLTVGSLNNVSQSGSNSTNVGLGSTISLDYSNNRTNKKTKTLATIGEGNINITNTEDSDTRMLNRDIENTEIDIYDISSKRGLKGELDTNLLTQKGRKKIKDDIKVSSKITDTISKIATLKDVSVVDFFKQTNQSVKQYEAYKEVLANNKQLANKLADKNLALEEKEKYANQFKIALEKKLGYKIANKVKVISTDKKGQGGKDIIGFISTENDNIYSNDKNQYSTGETIFALGQEFAGGIQKANGIDITKNREQHNNYQDSIAEDTVNDISFIMDTYYNKSLASSNTHNKAISNPLAFNLEANNNEFAGLDKEKGDNAIYMYNGKVVATDGINDKKVIDLTTKEVIEKGLYLDSYSKGRIKIIEQEDISKYNNVFNLDNENDFELLRKDTDMNYNGISSNTDVVFINGMDNTELQAQQSQSLIKNDFSNSNVGLINNQAGKYLGVVDDVIEWMPNALTTKDVLNAHQLQKLAPNTTIITHSAGNEDIYKANEVNSLVNANTPYKLISVGSPKSEADLKESTSKVGANVIRQINHPNDPVSNGWLNKGSNYDVEGYNPFNDLKFHSFEAYYYKYNLKEEIEKTKDHE